MEIPEHRKWMYKRLLPNRGGLRPEFVNGVREFVNQEIRKSQFTENGGKFRCPCDKHRNIDFLTPGDVMVDLYKYSLKPKYWCWDSHGESSLSTNNRNTNNVNKESTCSQSLDVESQRNPYESMVFDAIGPEHIPLISFELPYNFFSLGN